MAVAGVEMDHALQNLFCGFERTTGTQTLSGRGEELPCFGFLSQPDVNLGQARSHGCILRIHFQNFLENTDRLLQFAGTQKFFRDLQILGARIIEQALLGVQFGEFQNTLERGLDLGDFLVHGDGFDREALGGISIAHVLETRDGLVVVAEARVEIADGVRHRQIPGVILEDFFVLSDGVLQPALLDKFLRRAEDLLFVEAKTKRHMGADSSSGSRCTTYFWKLFTDGLICTGPMSRETAAMIRGMVTVRQL